MREGSVGSGPHNGGSMLSKCVCLMKPVSKWYGLCHSEEVKDFLLFHHLSNELCLMWCELQFSKNIFIHRKPFMKKTINEIEIEWKISFITFHYITATFFTTQCKECKQEQTNFPNAAWLLTYDFSVDLVTNTVTYWHRGSRFKACLFYRHFGQWVKHCREYTL